MPSLAIQNAKAAEPDASAALVTIHDFSATIPQESYQVRDAALAKAKKVEKVDDDTQLRAAVDALRQMKEIIKETDLTRRSLGAPFDAICKDLRNKEKEFISDVEKERDRLMGMSNNFELRKLRAAQEVKEQQEREAREAQVKADKAAAEAHRLAEEAKTAKGKKKEEIEASLLDAELAAEEAALEIPTTAIITVFPTKVAGFSAREVIEFEVTEPFAFCTAYPEFWKWDDESETLKLKRRDLHEELQKPTNRFTSTPFPEELPTNPNSLPRPAGLKLWRGIRSITR